jgi:hypothetical protein
MKFAFDTEAALIAPGLLAPPMACVSWANEQCGSGLFVAGRLLAGAYVETVWLN